MQPHKKGELTEATVITELKRREIPVSVPFGDNERYDLLIEAPDGCIYRAQVKTAATTDGAVNFRGYSQHTNSAGNIYKQYSEGVDCFLVYSHDYDRFFLVYESEIGMNMTLRIEPPKQEHDSINWADDFDFDERWPPGSDDPDEALSAHSESDRSISVVRRKLSEEEIPFVRSDGTTCDLIAVDSTGTRFRLDVRLGSVQNGRVRFNTTTSPQEPVDAYCVYAHELETLYLVPEDAFERSISLRVEEPAQADASINWASAYRFDEQWPPDGHPHRFR